MFPRLAAVSLIWILTATAAAQVDPWRATDAACPTSADELNRFIDVDMIPDLRAMGASIDHIPGLKLHEELRQGHDLKKWRIYYQLAKPYDPKKEILIVVPGGPGQAHDVLHFFEEFFADGVLMRRYNVIAMDHRGVGCSRHLFPHDPPVQSFKMRFAAADIEAIRRDLGGEAAKISIWGGSYGTMLGQTYALLFPKKLSRLLLNSAFSSYKDFARADLGFESLALDWDPALRAKFEALRVEAPELVLPFLDWSTRAMYSYFGRTREIPAKLDEILTLARAKDVAAALGKIKTAEWVMEPMMRAIACQEIFATPTNPGFHMFARNFAACAEFAPFYDFMDYTPYLDAIKTRTFLLGGEFDHVTPAFAMRAMAERLPNHFLYLDPDVGHGIFEKPECTKRLTHAFFADLPNRELKRIAQDPVCAAPPSPTPAKPLNMWPYQQ